MISDIQKFSPHHHVLKPYEHQDKIFQQTRSWEAYALFWEMGTGKTKPLLDTMVWLFLDQQIDGCLILSDKGAYLNWPLEEIPKHVPADLPIRVAAHGSYMRKEERLKCERILTAKDDLLDIGCMNIEALSGETGYKWARAFLEGHHTLMIIDESTSIKSPKAKRTKNAWRLGELAEYRRIASGTPITQSPMDLFGQCHFLKPGIIGHWSYTVFRASYAIIQTIRVGNRQFPKVTGYHHLDELKARLAQFSSRLTKAECLDLPEKIYEMEIIEMTPEQRTAYDTLRDEAVLQWESGTLTSTSALTTVEKLHQICCGHVRDDDGTIHDIPNDRIDALLEIVSRVQGKVLIWCNYQYDVERVMRALRDYWAGWETGGKYGWYAVDYYGRTSAKDRLLNLQQFHEEPRCRAFVGTPSTGGKGLTLVEAADVVYYSCGYKLEARLQSEDRCHRIGQTRNVTYTDIACAGSIDLKVIRALKAKKDIATEVLDLDRLVDLMRD